MKYQYIVFDMDGTLLDTKRALAISIERGLKKFPLEKNYPQKTLEMNWGGDVLTQVIDFVEKNSKKRMKREQIIKELIQCYNQDIWDAEIRPFPGIISILKRLKEQGISFFVYSNSPEDIAQSLIEYYFPGMFEVVIGLTDEIKKPDAVALKELFAKNEICLSQVLMVGDTITDYQTALNGGIDFIGAGWDNTLQMYKMISQLKGKVFNTPEQLAEAIL